MRRKVLCRRLPITVSTLIVILTRTVIPRQAVYCPERSDGARDPLSSGTVEGSPSAEAPAPHRHPEQGRSPVVEGSPR